MGACALRRPKSAESTVAPRAEDGGPVRLFPMYVVRVEDFLRMTISEPHQILEARGVATVFSGLPIAAFVSHQWCGRASADPHFRQLSVLQNVFLRAAEGTLAIDVDMFSAIAYKSKPSVRPTHLRGVRKWVMWYDYFSVPQPGVAESVLAQHANLAGALGKAVASLSTYIDACAVFLVLAPTMEHEDGYMMDYVSWRARGWCRFERVARQLSSAGGPILLVRRTDTVFEIGAQDYLLDPMGCGDFSFEEDRARLAPIVQQLLRGKLQRLLDEARFEECRHLLSWCHGIVRGLPVTWQAAVPLALLARGGGTASLQWPPNDSGAARLWGPRPLSLAAGIGDDALLQSILCQRADVTNSQRGDVPEYLSVDGQDAIHIAALHGHVGAVAMLLERRASVDARDGIGQTPLFSGVLSGAASVTKFLLRRRARLDIKTNTGADTMQVAAVFGKADIVGLLLAAGAPCSANEHGISPLHNCAAFRSGSEVVRSMLLARGCPEDRIMPLVGSMPWVLVSTLALSYRLGRRSFTSLLGFHSWGATPLMVAAMFDNYQAAQELVRALANCLATNSRGASAAQLAELFGTHGSPIIRLVSTTQVEASCD